MFVRVLVVFFVSITYHNVSTILGTYPRRLEPRIIPWNGKNKPLGSTVFCCPDDFRKLCPIQLASRYFSRRIFKSGKPNGSISIMRVLQ